MVEPGSERGSIRSRSTSDLIILILAAFIGLTILLAAVSLFLTEILHPSQDTSQAVTALAGIVTGSVNVILGAIAGFIAGRGSARHASPEE